MAFTTSLQTDNVLLRGLNFRYNNNAPPSTFFTIYASGNGHTYWSNSITTDNLSTFSTLAANTTSTINSQFYITNSSINDLYNGLSTNFGADASTSYALGTSITTLSNNVNVLSNTFVQFAIVTNSKLAAYDTFISTTVEQSLSSAVATISTGQIFFDSISSVRIEAQAGLSSLSTTIAVSNSTLYGSITYQYNSTISHSLVSTTAQLELQITELSNASVYLNDFGAFSTFMLSSLFSTSTDTLQQISSLSTYIVSSYNAILNSSFMSFEDTFNAQDARISSLEGLSTNLSSITNFWISSYITSFLSTNNSTIFDYIQQNSNAIEQTNQDLLTLTTSVSSLSSYVTMYNSGNDNNVSTLYGNVYFFSTAYQLLSVSSILVNIWSSFVELAVYTNNLLGQIYSSIFVFQSTLYNSTVIMNTSTANRYFNYYVSTLYASTLSTLVPSTIVFTSSMVSTLYSTSYYALNSTLNNTVNTTTSSFISTSYGLANVFTSTNAYGFQSSVIGYLSTPAVNTFSTINSQANSTITFLNNVGVSSATQFGIFYSTISSQNSILYNSTIAINTLAVSTLNIVTNAFSTQLSTNTSSFNAQLNLQSTIFNSTLSNYNLAFASTSGAAYNYIIGSTISVTSTAAGIVTTSTVNSYNAYISSLNSNISLIGVSTLYTNTTLLINSTTRTQIMDLTTYRNFQINIRDISNSGVYTLTYSNSALTGQDYRRGIITLDISTVGQNYSNFNGALIFNANTLGIPTTVWGAVIPYIGNSDYVAQYEYTILNSILWTNLLGLYPRVAVRNPQAITPLLYVYNIGLGTSNLDPNTYFRGQPINIAWSNYSFFPYAPIGGPNFNPYVVVETNLSGSTYNTFGPFPFSQSTAQITAPYPTGSQSIVQSGTINIYVLGYANTIVQIPLKVVQPTFDYLYFRPTTAPPNLSSGGYTFIGGYELVAQSDNGNYPFFGAANNVYNNTVPGYGSTGVTYYNINSNYNNNKLFTNVVNTVGYNGSPNSQIYLSNGSTSTQNTFVEYSQQRGYLDFMIYRSSYFYPMQLYLSNGGRIDVTLNSGTVSTFIPNISIRPIGRASTVYEIYNTGVSATSNIFNGTESNINITYSISTVGLVNRGQTPFIGPVGGPFAGPVVQFADTQCYMEVPYPASGSSRRDPVSTVLYYNLVNSVLTSSYTVGDTFETRVIPGDGFQYIYTFSTNASPFVQTYNF